MSRYITTHDDKGAATFASKVPTEPHIHDIPGGTLEFLYTTHSFPPNLSTESDIDQYAHDRVHGLNDGRICPEKGMAAALVTLQPNAVSMTHRTTTLDILLVIEGVIELHLDNGETRTLHAGDSVVQRGTIHKWVNVTPNNGIAKQMAFAMPIVEPFEIQGKVLETEWRQS